MDLLQEFLTQHFWHLGLESSLQQVVLCISSIRGLVRWCQWHLFLISLDTEAHLQTLPNVPFRANYSWWKWLQHPLTWETPSGMSSLCLITKYEYQQSSEHSIRVIIIFKDCSSCGLFLTVYWICYNIASVFRVFFFCSWGMWALSSSTRDGNHTPCIGRHSLNQCTSMEVPELFVNGF